MKPKFKFDLSIPSVVAFADRMDKLHPAEWTIYRFSMKLKPYDGSSENNSDRIVDFVRHFFQTICTLSGASPRIAALPRVPQLITWSDYDMASESEKTPVMNSITIEGFVAVSAEWPFSECLEDALKHPDVGIWTHPAYNFEQLEIVMAGAQKRPVQAGLAGFLIPKHPDISDDPSVICLPLF